MSHEDEARELLTSLRQIADDRLARAEAALAALTRDRLSESDDDEHDPEGVPLSAEWSRLTGLVESARTELGQIDDALARVEVGEYGICAACGKAIPRERLEVRPFASTCVPCAS